MPSLRSVARSTTSRSTGGAPSGCTSPSGPDRISTKSRPASSTSGIAATSHTRLAGGWVTTVSGITAWSARFEKAHPAKLGELALVGVEHELARIPEPRLDDRALALAQHQGVGGLGRRQRRAGAVGVEEHPVQVDAVDQVELGDVHHIHA